MKFSNPFLVRALAVWCLTVASGALAQEAPVAPESSAVVAAPASSATPPAADAQSPDAASAANAASTAPIAPAAPAEPVAPATPASEAAPAAPAEVAAPAAETAPAAPAADEPDRERAQRQNRRWRNQGGDHDDLPLGDHVISADGRVREAVSLFGSTTVEGEVASDAVSIFGDTTVAENAEVHGAAVAVMGRLNVRGRVHGEAVNVMGASTINNRVGGEAVAVMSDLTLGPDAVIEGDLIVVGGTITRDPGAVVNGNVQHIRIPVLGSVGGFDGISTWVTKCLLFGRLLAFDAKVIWAWWIAIGFVVFYVALSLLFRDGVEACVRTFETRPGSTVVASILTVLLLPVLTVLLVLTVVGGVIVPFIGIAAFFATLFGKAVVLAWLGRRITKYFGEGPLNHAAFATLVGGAIVLLLYVVPVLGIIMYKVLGVLGLGVVIYTLILRSQREKTPATAGVAAAAASPAPMPASPPPSAGIPAGVIAEPPPATIPPMASAVSQPATIGATSAGFTGTTTASAAGTTSAAGLPPPVMPGVPMTTLPRAGFWIRTGALALDVILIAVILGVMSGLLPRFLEINGPSGVLPALAIYGAVMWKMKGTTIGGIICGLKVVRVDGRELDWATAIVRALSCFLSLVVVGLGFIWVVIDDDKQSWHDKIAGTTVVRVPKGTPLV